MSKDKIVIAIDGYSGCGKSSTAKIVAKRLGYLYIDTGAMYRAVTLFFIQNGISVSDLEKVKASLSDVCLSFRLNKEKQRNEMYLNGLNVEDEIRKMYVSEKVSPVSAIKEVREDMVRLQREFAKFKGVVLDGRDVGTVVFPDAELKIFMQTDVKVRAKRRKEELSKKGEEVSLEDVIQNFVKRDEMDTSRKESPLVKAEDAMVLDSTNLLFEEQVEVIVNEAKKRLQ